MRLNIFKIPAEKVTDLRLKLPSVGLEEINVGNFGRWKATFYFSSNPVPKRVSWVADFSDFFSEVKPENRTYFAVYLWENVENCFAISYGKSHFFLRQYCDHNFGIEVAKRIADQIDVRQKASKKFAGNKTKEIRSYTKSSKLDIESGESVDYLRAAITEGKQEIFGRSGKFGSSANLNPDIKREEIDNFLDNLIQDVGAKELFALPRTVVIEGFPETESYEDGLVKAIRGIGSNADFSASSYELIGVDFIFSGQEKYEFYWKGNWSEPINELSIEKLNEFIDAHSVVASELLDIRIKITSEDGFGYTQSLKESLDYIVDGENVILSQGKWMRFNEDYLVQLDEYIDSIDLEDVESDLIEVEGTEADFNTSLTQKGYDVADKDFSKIKVSTGALVEAWDLKKGSTVYAVKFGTAQKLGYVCDQANNTLELIAKKANIKKLEIDFDTFCLWLCIDVKNRPERLSQINSVILKQKIEWWARKCLELGITPKIKISRHKT